MPRTRDISLTLALCLSLVAHAGFVVWKSEQYVRSWAGLFLPPLPLPPGRLDVSPVTDVPPVVRVIDRMDRLGADTSAGAALADSPGDEPQVAPRASQEQASLSLDPEGTGGTEASKPLPPSPPAFEPAAAADTAAPQPKFEVPGSSATPLQPVAIAPKPRGDFLPQSESKPTDAPQDAPPTDQPSDADQPPATDTVASAAPQAVEQLTQDSKPADPSQQPPQPQTAQRPTPPRNAELPGDPAPLADSESDAFGTEPAVEFRRGKTVARLGRKHKLFSPRLEMAAYADLLQLQSPVRIVLRLTIDGTGNVVKADIIKSSGSINLDQPTRQAAYRWWFEPRRAANGPLEEETFDFVVGFS